MPRAASRPSPCTCTRSGPSGSSACRPSPPGSSTASSMTGQAPRPSSGVRGWAPGRWVGPGFGDWAGLGSGGLLNRCLGYFTQECAVRATVLPASHPPSRFFWVLVLTISMFVVFSLLSAFTDQYMFPLKPKGSPDPAPLARARTHTDTHLDPMRNALLGIPPDGVPVTRSSWGVQCVATPPKAVGGDPHPPRAKGRGGQRQGKPLVHPPPRREA